MKLFNLLFKSNNMWWVYALLSALFAALTAIFAKIGVSNMNSNLATAIRTVVILLVAWGIVLARNETKGITTLSRQNLLFLVISGITTGLSWVSQVAPVDKLSIALTIILSAVFLKEVMTARVLAGALLIIAGTLVLIK
mgnify:CR=1 FL=1